MIPSYLLTFKSLSIVSLAQERKFSIVKSLIRIDSTTIPPYLLISKSLLIVLSRFDYDSFMPSHFQIFVNRFTRFRRGNFPIVKSLIRVDSITIPPYFLTSKSFPIVSLRFLHTFSLSNPCLIISLVSGAEIFHS